MSLDTHIDYELKYSTDVEHSSLHKWCIREFDSDGNQIGRDLMPWRYSLWFRAEDISYNFEISCDRSSLFVDLQLEGEDEDQEG